MLHPVEGIVGELDPFLAIALSRSLDQGIELSGKEIDHVCFRCTSKKEYLSICSQLVDQQLGEVMIESMIGGRPITTFKLFEPIQYNEYSIACLEIPCPKPGKSHHAGLEHLEVVVGKNGDLPFDNKLVLEEWASSYPSVSFDRKAIDKHINADICLDLGDGVNIKFHICPLYEVVEIEKKSGSAVSVPSDYFLD